MRQGVFEFHYDYGKDMITKIYTAKEFHDFEKEMLDEENIFLTDKWLQGSKQFALGKDNIGSIYMLEPVTELKNPKLEHSHTNTYRNFTRIHLKENSENNFKVIAEIPGSSIPRYHYLMDNKLFLTSIGYDDGYKPQIIYLNTGKVEEIESNIYGAAMVPVGKHKMLYCSSKSQFILDTRILNRKHINDKKLPCPNKTGAFLKYPKEGYFIYNDWEMM